MKSCTLKTIMFTTASLLSLAINAQNNGKLQLIKGQKLQVVNNLISVATMEMMGQSVEMKSDAFMQHLLEVKDKKDTSYHISATLTKLNSSGTVMEQNFNFDSDNKKDRDSSEMGKLLKDQLNIPKDLEVSNKGILITQQKTEPAANDENPMMGMMKSMTGSSSDFSNVATDIFQVLPKGSKQGDNWSDSSNSNGVKTLKTYTIKEINNNIAVVTLSGSQTTTKTLQQMGTEVNILLSAKLSGESKIDLATGLVQEKTLVIEGTGSADAMGQNMPMTMKVTSSTNVKKN